MMMLFDWPEHLVSIGQRSSTTVAPQALAFLNSPHVRTCAHAFGKRLLSAYEQSPSEAVREGYLAAIGRSPDEQELAASTAFLPRLMSAWIAAVPPAAARAVAV